MHSAWRGLGSSAAGRAFRCEAGLCWLQPYAELNSLCMQLPSVIRTP